MCKKTICGPGCSYRWRGNIKKAHWGISWYYQKDQLQFAKTWQTNFFYLIALGERWWINWIIFEAQINVDRFWPQGTDHGLRLI